MTKAGAYLLDVEAARFRGESGVRLMLKHAGNGKTFAAFAAFEPYFYVLPADQASAEKRASALTALARGGGTARVKRVEPVERLLNGRPAKLLKLFLSDPGHVPAMREEAKAIGETFEDGIPFARRFVLDSGLVPSAVAEFDFGKAGGRRVVKSFTPIAAGESPHPALETMAFDIETHNPGGMPNASKDPCLMVSFASGKEQGVITYAKETRKPFVTHVKDEKEMLSKFSQVLREQGVDVLCGYNSDEFDLPYLKERARVLRTTLALGRDKRGFLLIKQLGQRRRARLAGRIHLDCYNAASFLDYVGAVKFDRLTLGAVYKALTGETKLDIKKPAIWKAWDAGGAELAHLLDYSLDDAVAAKAVADFVLPLETELSRVTAMTLFDVSRATPGQMVEALLMRRAFVRNEVVPSKPAYAAVQARADDAIQGAFVKMPEPGVYRNIAVFDFRSLYPSIIISHNIDPTTLNCECCGEQGFAAPNGAHFCRKRRGLVPEMLETVLKERIAVKKKMKAMEKGSPDYRALDSRQFALKILANSTYGYLVYSRSRYYSRDSGEAVTALARQFIQQTMAKAEEAGFQVLYGDTDSIFLLHSGDKVKVLSFRDSVNKALPSGMELELEDFYPSGIFVSKKQEEKGAKKKYALINEQGAIKIRGFELVRRDWSAVARNTQRKVLDILLKEGDVQKAVDLVYAVIKDLRAGKIPLEDCAIRTQLRKKADAYDIVSPEVSAVKKARAAGLDVGEMSLVEYVITRGGRSVSEKATLLEQAGDYDPDYYVNNQVLPAVLKILGALGIKEEDLKTKGVQKGLGEW